jgi:hypothetical protein
MANASIPLQIRPIAIEPQSNRLLRMLQLEEAQQANALRSAMLADRERAQQEQNRLRAIYSGGLQGEDLERELLQQGFADQALKFGKDRRESMKLDAQTGKARAEQREKELKIAQSRLQFGLQTGSALLSEKTPLTRERVAEAMLPGLSAGVLDEETARAFLSSLPEDDAGIRTALQRGMEASLTAKDRLDQAFKEKQFALDARKADEQARHNRATVAATLRGQDMTFNRPQVVGVEGVGPFAYTPSGGFVRATDEQGRPISAPSTGEKALDTAIAKDYAEYVAGGGFTDQQKLIGQLREARQMLAQTPDASGPYRGLVPDKVRAITNPKAIQIKERIEEAVQRNLRSVLGAQFTEREGERLIARAYNPQLSAAENAKRLDRLIRQLETAAAAKADAMRYFEQHGSLRGWKGRMPSMADFEAAVETPQGGGATGGWSIQRVE